MARPVVVMTPDVVGARMAGPGIRAYHFAHELAKSFDTALVAVFQDEGSLDLDDVRLAELRSVDAEDLLLGARAVIGQPHRVTLRAARAGVPVIFDLFAPVLLELDQVRAGLRGRIHRVLEARRILRSLKLGGPLVVATDAQKELYSGVAPRAGESIDESRWLTVPFGVPAEDPPVVAKASPPVVIWNGGVWPWLDPATAVAAIEEVNRRETEARLVFMGTGRPNRDVAAALPGLDSLEETDLVEWNPDWVPYLERGEVLGRASISLMLHGNTEESKYSIRTRLFDAIWCGIPVVATRGGFAAELVESEGLGVVVPPGDVSAVAGAIESLLRSDVLYSRSVSALMEVRSRFRWSEVCRPLVEAIEALPPIR